MSSGSAEHLLVMNSQQTASLPWRRQVAMA